VKPVVISLCDKSGVMVTPWADAGYECWCVDIQHSIRADRQEGNTIFTWGDARAWKPPAEIRGRIAMVFAFPPCTHDAVSGARDFQKKGNIMLRDSLELFSACEMVAAWSSAPYMIEHPVSVISTHYRKPDFKFQPWQYGDLWTKETWLWTGNGFVMPPALHIAQPEGVTEKIWRMPPSPERANLRAETPPGFARAVFDANESGARQGRKAA
jgi:hypothetical protein